MNAADSRCCDAQFDARLKMILDNPFEGSIAIDENGSIFFVNSFFFRDSKLRRRRGSR